MSNLDKYKKLNNAGNYKDRTRTYVTICHPGSGCQGYSRFVLVRTHQHSISIRSPYDMYDEIRFQNLELPCTPEKYCLIAFV